MSTWKFTFTVGEKATRRFSFDCFACRHCLSQNNTRTNSSPFSQHQFTDLTNLIDYSPPTNMFTESDDLNDPSGNKKFIAKRAQIGIRKTKHFSNSKFEIFPILFSRYD